ncbi:MAG: isochorismate synthase [Cyanobacteria bacterium CRU_2_1]|nr:isochorismate synthase [Cyanobacteria bacterium RU_5_0]NJR59098.1 isochorismate synthase [Cyanobacteria bacterium CRU_2_1]
MITLFKIVTNATLWIRNMLQYVAEAASRIFSPNQDEYPDVGVQPFDGDSCSKWM